MPRPNRFLAIALTAAMASIGAFVAPASAQQQGKPGDFDYYALVLTWSPSYCAGEGASRNEAQCDGSRPYAFVLHGLWPQYERGYPQTCRTRNKPWVPKKIIEQMLDIMPSTGLVIHQYKKHGTCSGLDPKEYFSLARRLFGRIAIPDRFRAPSETIVASPVDIEREFLAANPKLKPDMMSVVCGKPNRLRELRICFSLAGDLRACGENEDQDRLCRADRISMPPVRGKTAGKAGDKSDGSGDTLGDPI